MSRRRALHSAGSGTEDREHEEQGRIVEGAERSRERKTQAALLALVRQSRQSRHDGAVHRALSQFRPHPGGVALGQAHHRHRPDRLRPFALQSPPYRTRQARPRRNPHGRRRSLRISGASDPGDGQAADRGARPQPRLSRPRRDSLRLFHRRRRADDRLRQDDAGLHHGRRDRQSARHRALGRPDEQRLASRRAHRFGHDRLEGPRRTRRGQDRLRAVHGNRYLVGALGRPLQHDGHGLDDERARRSARHEPARLRGDSRPASRARPDRLRNGQAHRRAWFGRI